jgi:hypothetical protein
VSERMYELLLLYDSGGLDLESESLELIALQQQEIERLREELRKLTGVRNLLADKAALLSGMPVPMEIEKAEKAESRGAESWDWRRRVYVNEMAKEVEGE